MFGLGRQGKLFTVSGAGGGLIVMMFQLLRMLCGRCRYEAHLWIPKKGKQVYLGGFNTQRAAACAYDIGALKVKGENAKTNFRKEL